jgi:hypothetical protein
VPRSEWHIGTALRLTKKKTIAPGFLITYHA